jgi:hypothetical protein
MLLQRNKQTIVQKTSLLTTAERRVRYTLYNPFENSRISCSKDLADSVQVHLADFFVESWGKGETTVFIYLR